MYVRVCVCVCVRVFELVCVCVCVFCRHVLDSLSPALPVSTSLYYNKLVYLYIYFTDSRVFELHADKMVTQCLREVFLVLFLVCSRFSWSYSLHRTFKVALFRSVGVSVVCCVIRTTESTVLAAVLLCPPEQRHLGTDVRAVLLTVSYRVDARWR